MKTNYLETFINIKEDLLLALKQTFYMVGTSLIFAVIIGGLVEGTLGLFAKYWIKLIPPVVAATVVTAIGFSLLPVGANSFAGGQGAADFGSVNNWIVGSITLLACLLCQIFAKGFLRSLSVLMGLIVGYILACFMGMVNFYWCWYYWNC